MNHLKIINMKKLQLRALDLGVNRTLNREELKKVKGGNSAFCYSCSRSRQCPADQYCANGCCFTA